MLTANEKTAVKVGLGLLAAGAVGYALWPKKASAAQSEVPPGDGGDETPPAIEPTYSLKPAAVLDFGALPVLRPAQGNTPGSSMLLWADSAPTLLAAQYFQSYGVTSGNQTVAETMGNLANPEVTKHFIATFAGEMGPDPRSDYPAADVYVIFLGPVEEPSPDDAQHIADIRQAFGSQRIVWVLSASTAPAIAKVLTEALPHEEWVRTRTDDPEEIATTAWKFLTAPDVNATNAV